MAAIVTNGEVFLSGTVGDTFFEDGFDAQDVVLALAQVGDAPDLTVHLNSGGGIATEGAAIHAVLASHPGHVTVSVEGIAASAASLIAMAGDTIVMQPGAVMMIHDPAMITMGDAAAHAKSIEALDVLGSAYAGIYARRSGKSPEDARAMMQSETWLTAEAAVAAGLADEIGAGDTAEPTAFNYRMYACAPKTLVAMADANGWARGSRVQKQSIAASAPADALDSARADGASLERDRIKAIMAASAGREALANHFAFDTSMSAADAIAALELSPAAKPAATLQAEIDDYVASRTAGLAAPKVPPARDHGWDKVISRQRLAADARP